MAAFQASKEAALGSATYSLVPTPRAERIPYSLVVVREEPARVGDTSAPSNLCRHLHSFHFSFPRLLLLLVYKLLPFPFGPQREFQFTPACVCLTLDAIVVVVALQSPPAHPRSQGALFNHLLIVFIIAEFPEPQGVQPFFRIQRPFWRQLCRNTSEHVI